MKKLSLLLAIVLLLGTLAACNPETTDEPNQLIPGYQIGLNIGNGWTAIEESEYDLALEKNGMQLYAYGFSPADFVDMPTAEDLFIDCTATIVEGLTEVRTVTEESSYTAGSKQVMTVTYAGKEGDTEKQFYCSVVDFADESGCLAFVAFAAKEGDMKKNKDSFKAMVDGMVCTAEPYDYESAMEDEILFDEDGNPIYPDVTEPGDIPYDESEPTYEENPPEPTETVEETAEATTAATTTATTTAATEG